MVAALMIPSVLFADKTKGLQAELETLGEGKKKELLAVMNDNKESLVLVEIAVKIKANIRGQERPPQENKFRIPGTMIRKDGLTVVSMQRADPSIGIKARLQNQPGVKVEVDVLSCMIILNDATELEAKFVLKDEDLDIGFIMPSEKQEEAFSHVKLDESVKPKLLDSVTLVSRMDFDANRTPVIRKGSISAIIEKPRVYYYGPASTPGLPAFDKDGKCFGLYLMRKTVMNKKPMTLILPAKEILSAVKKIKK